MTRKQQQTNKHHSIHRIQCKRTTKKCNDITDDQCVILDGVLHPYHTTWQYIKQLNSHHFRYSTNENRCRCLIHRNRSLHCRKFVIIGMISNSVMKSTEIKYRKLSKSAENTISSRTTSVCGQTRDSTNV